MKDSVLQGEKVELRQITFVDTDNIIKWRNSDHVRCYFLDQRPFTKQGHETWLRSMVDTGKASQFIIIQSELNIPIGSVYLRDIEIGRAHV